MLRSCRKVPRSRSMATGHKVNRIKIRLFKCLACSFCLILELAAWLTIKKEVLNLHEKIRELKGRSSPILDEKLLAVLMVGEDHRFFYHRGVDPIAIARACIGICKGMRQGGSTIEQQLVRTITNDYRYSLSRKIKEALLSTTINRLLNKNEIATLYLAIAYFGYRMQGINEAYLRLDIALLPSVEQYCQLITHLKYPLKKEYCFKQEKRCEVRHLYLQANLMRQKDWLFTKDVSSQAINHATVVSSSTHLNPHR